MTKEYFIGQFRNYKIKHNLHIILLFVWLSHRCRFFVRPAVRQYVLYVTVLSMNASEHLLQFINQVQELCEGNAIILSQLIDKLTTHSNCSGRPSRGVQRAESNLPIAPAGLTYFSWRQN